MKTANIFHVTDWNIRKFLALIGIIQFLMLFTLLINAADLEIPLFQSFVGFLYLTFVPGVLILRILKIHHLPSTDMLLYTVGLSISSIMFLGFFVDFIYPLIGIAKPFAYFNIIVTITVFVLILMGLAYFRDKSFYADTTMDPKFIWAPSTLILLLLPLITVLGAYMVNYYENNILLMLLIFLIAVFTLLIGFNRFFTPKIYPLAIFIFAISLLLHRSLVPGYLWGADIQIEYYFSNFVLNSGLWSWGVTHPYNGVLSTNILAPIYSIFCNMDISWVFKTIYQFLYALVPLGLYSIFKKQTNSKIAFFACFFFIALSTFYSEMPALARQEIAELFLVVLILLYFNETIDKVKFSFLFIIFIFSIITSHYALSYVYMMILGFSWVLIYLVNKYEVWKPYVPKITSFAWLKSLIIKNINPKFFKGETKVSSGHVLLFIVFTVTWYIYIASSSSFNQLVRIGGKISGNIFTEFLDPKSTQGLFILTSSSNSVLYSLSKTLLIIAQIFIIVGLLSIIFSKKKIKFQRDFLYFSITNFVLLVSLVIVPLFSNSLNTTRLYHISLIFLAPYCIIGGIILIKEFNKCLAFNKYLLKIKNFKLFANPLKILSIFFVVIFLFSTGFTYEITKNQPNSGSLSQNWIKEFGSPTDKIAFFSGYTPEQNVASSKWLFEKREKTTLMTVFSSPTDQPQVISFNNVPYGLLSIQDLSNLTANYNGSFIYLGYLEVNYGIVPSGESIYVQKTLYIDLSQIESRINNTDRIYDNGDSEIYSGV